VYIYDNDLINFGFLAIHGILIVALLAMI